MGFGKILGLAVLGVGAVAAAPFTGGGSIFAAVTAAGSLVGAGAIATGAGVAGAAAGVALSVNENKEEERRTEELFGLKRKAEKFEASIKNAIHEFGTDKEYFNYIIALTAIGMAVANADGNVSEEEITEMNEFIGGIANEKYPTHVTKAIITLKDNPPTFKEAMVYMEKVKQSNHESIKDLIEVVIAADNEDDEKEIAFLEAFNSAIKMIDYTPKTKEDKKNDEFVSVLKGRLSIV